MMERRRLLAGLAGAVIITILGLSSCDSALREQIELYVDGGRQIRAEGIVHVDGATGDDANPGTRDLPKKTIQNAIDLADQLLDTGEVHVAEGTYQVYETLEVKDGISLYGGFQASDWTRDIDAYTTVLQGVSIDTVVKPERGVTPTTVIEGFTIKAASVTEATCIWCENSSPTIQRNNLDASQGITDTIGIFNSSSSPVILANTINAGDGTDAAWGIANSSSPAKIWSNVIYGSGGSGTYKGVLNSNSDAIVQNNTICFAQSPWDDQYYDVGIYNLSSNCIIENNIFFSSSSGSGCAIEGGGPDSLPLRVNKNDFWDVDADDSNPPYVYGYDSGWCDTLGDLELYLTDNSVDHSGNVNVDPDFVDQDVMDCHLDGGSPIKGVISDPPVTFSRDRDWIPRTVPWSIGAYEQD